MFALSGSVNYIFGYGVIHIAIDDLSKKVCALETINSKLYLEVSNLKVEVSEKIDALMGLFKLREVGRH